MKKCQCVAVYCGSSSGNQSIYAEQAWLLGKRLAENNIEIVYGGGQTGLMGAVANGALAAGGKVTGVIPAFLCTKELAHEGLSQLIVVNSMHERKYTMCEMCDAVITLPGGFGTMDEFFEMITWNQLEIHQKPIALMNINNYFDPLLQQLNNMVAEGFLKNEHHQKIICVNTVDEVIQKLPAAIMMMGENGTGN